MSISRSTLAVILAWIVSLLDLGISYIWWDANLPHTICPLTLPILMLYDIIHELEEMKGICWPLAEH